MLPQVIDPEDVGESSYDTALKWDNIHAARHDKYFDFAQILPLIKQQHDQRTTINPDMLFIKDQYHLSKTFKQNDKLSLNKETRLKEKNERELALLEIENKRRKAKGEATLESFAELQKEDSDDEDLSATKIEPSKDALLLETGNILADYIRIETEKRTASRNLIKKAQ